MSVFPPEPTWEPYKVQVVAMLLAEIFTAN